MHKRHFARMVAVVGATALLASGCNSSSTAGGGTTASGGKTCNLSLAFFGALTGSSANLGVNIEQGAELAVNQYNAKHPDCKVSIKKADSEGDPAKAPALARSLVADKTLVGIIGPAFSGESKAADPIFDQAGIPLITPSATLSSLSSNGWKTFHRGLGSNAAEGSAAAQIIKQDLKATKVFVADDQSAFGADLADAVKAGLGSLVVGTDKTSADGKQTDFSATVTKVKASGATVVFYGGYYQNAGLITAQMAQAGLKVTMVSDDGAKDPGFVTAAGKAAAEGAIVTCPCAPSDPGKATFLADYKSAFKIEAGTYSDGAFDAANLFLAAIAAGNTTGDKVNTYLSTANYKGVSTTFKFTPTGELDPGSVKMWAYKFTNGQVTPLRQVTLS